MYPDTVQDCTEAIKLLDREQELIVEQLISQDSNEMEKRRKLRVKLLARKGIATYKMGNVKGGISDLTGALQMDPMNAELRENIQQMCISE